MDDNRGPVMEGFEAGAPARASSPVVNDAETERDGMEERFDALSSDTRRGAEERAPAIVDDESPPPTHFVEIKLPPPVAQQHPALPEESSVATSATAASGDAATRVLAQPVEAAPAPSIPKPPAYVPALPKISLELPPDSDLVLIETSHAKQAPPPEEIEAPRPRRVRSPRVEVAEGPLQLVETAPKEPAPPGA